MTIQPTPSTIRWGVLAAWWALALAGASVGAALAHGIGDHPLAKTAVLACTMFSPAAATVIIDRLAPRADPLVWRPALNRWWFAASALGLTISVLAMAFAPLWPSTSVDLSLAPLITRLGLDATQAAEVRATLDAMPVHPALLMIPQALVAGATLNALFAFGEEIGWRGWCDRELRPLGFWRYSALTGAMWGLWHAPLIAGGHNYPNDRAPGVLLFTAICIGLAPLHSWIHERSGTIAAAAVLHGTINATAGLSLLVIAGPELVVGVQGLAGLAGLIVLNGALALLRRPPKG